MSATRPPAFDDRFTAPIEASRRGAHRARPKPVSAGLPVIAGAAVVLLVLGGAYTLLGNRSDTDSSPSAAITDDDGSAPTATGGAGAATTPAPASTTAPAADPTTVPADPTTSSPAAGGGAAAGVDKSIDVIVLNSGKIAGLAKRLGATLKTNGWSVPRTGNSIQHNLPATKIYYGTDAQKATATALQQEIGFGDLVQDSSVTTTAKGIVVVLGKDAE